MASIRQERVAELLKRELSMLFQKESNTWFGGLFITVTQVRIGPDLGLAKVYLSFMAVPDKHEASETSRTRRMACAKGPRRQGWQATSPGSRIEFLRGRQLGFCG